MEYADWKAPGEDGQMVLWPGAHQIIEQTLANQRLLSAGPCRIQNVPVCELRRQARQWLGHRDDARPMIASGHQTELYHPGVWAKDALLHAAAGKLDAQAYHFAVDTDQPRHLHLRWPTVLGDGSDAPHATQSFPITDDADINAAKWAALLNAPSPAHIAGIRTALEHSRFQFEPMLGDFLLSLRRLAIEAPNLPAALTNATHELSWSLGLRHHALLCGMMWGSSAYLAFTYHILANAVRFASDYNRALSDYRQEQKIRGSTRPMPDLPASGSAIELPFWMDQLSEGRRARASVQRWGDDLVLKTPTGEGLPLIRTLDGWEAAGKLGDFLTRNHLRLSPRALTLTLFLRLLVVDTFVHGIGGGRYDQITDRLIRAHFGIEPPSFAVTTATLYFPDALGRTRACLPCVMRDGHQLRHSLLGERKREMVSAISAAPRKSFDRRELFAKMHQELTAAALANPKIERWQQELRETERRSVEEQTLFDRELFFAVQPRSRLVKLIERYIGEFR
jgi:hypothetical protein